MISCKCTIEGSSNCCILLKRNTVYLTEIKKENYIIFFIISVNEKLL